RARLGPAYAARGWPLRLLALDTLAVRGEEAWSSATLLVIGNPPWAGRSANREARLTERWLDDFRREPDGTPLRERKIGVLSDDYVRFWRWACELARGARGGAVVALVTNASFLDGPVHRGMRAALSRWFTRIDVVDLGGSALVARTGERDDNVFGVRPGTAITIAARDPGHDERRAASVRYARLHGSTSDKLGSLSGSVERETLAAPQVFVPTPAPGGYERWPSLAELMPFHREGLQTNRDALCVDVDRASLLARLRAWASGEAIGPPASRHFDPSAARAALASDPHLREHVRLLDYRPFDRRFVVTLPAICHRARPELLAAVDASPFSLITVRKDRGARAWTHAALSRVAIDNCYLSARSSCRARAFPTHDPSGAPNLDPRALARFAAALSDAPP
ncbi:MAG: hypothetical protein K8H88_19695, partial [Sandaracinaceae bacterium]|nr:hypothetical protein [Sandaracinaceae bacterium]